MSNELLEKRNPKNPNPFANEKYYTYKDKCPMEKLVTIEYKKTSDDTKVVGVLCGGGDGGGSSGGSGERRCGGGGERRCGGGGGGI